MDNPETPRNFEHAGHRTMTKKTQHRQVMGFIPDNPAFSINEINHYAITDILLTVVLITHTPYTSKRCRTQDDDKENTTQKTKKMSNTDATKNRG
jgi:hypothetical protein